MRIIERYPLRLVNAILRGLVQEAQSLSSLYAFEVGQHVDEPEVWQIYPEYYKEIYDAISGALLDPEKVKAATTMTEVTSTPRRQPIL